MATRDISERPIITWLDKQKPNTLMMFECPEPLILSAERFTSSLNRHDRRGGISSYMEAIELRICAWPKPGEPQALLEKRNVAAMETLALAFRLYSR